MPNQFSIPLPTIAEILKRRLDAVIRKQVEFVVTEAIVKSPVDTGQFRGSWVYGAGSQNLGTTGVLDRTGMVSVARVKGEFFKSELAQTHYFSSNVDYAVALERGKSTQNERMVRKAAARLHSVLDDLVTEAQNEHRIR